MESTESITDVPSLVDSDFELWTDCLGDYISVWLQNSPQFIHEQQQKMLRLALGPFLFGVTCNLPHAWQEILHSCGVIEKERENKTTCLSEIELDTLEMAETVFVRCSQLVENKNDLKTILNFIYEVEERSALLGRIDINYALQEVVSLEVFASMWAPMKRFYERRKKQAHICIIYYFKIISHQIVLYGRDGVDTTEFVKRVISELHRAEKEGSFSSGDGNKAFTDGDFELAVKYYSSVIEREPLSSLLYSNRAQAYLNLCDYRSALCDSKRAIILDPKNSKHYYRAAKSYLELEQLDKAEDTNNQALKCCTDPQQREAILQQSLEIRAKSRMTKLGQNVNNSESEEREVDDTKVQYKRFIYEGSQFYLTNVYSRAVEQFKSALAMVARPGSESLTVEEDDLLVVWFIYGMSCVKTGNIRNLQSAVEKFHAIISRSEAFPAAYYGLGLAYMALKRYKDAEEVLKLGLEKLGQCGDSRVYLWPQTNKIIEETDSSTVKKLMENMMKECMYPPKPDAVCKFHADTDCSKKEIYISDPDYKGYICIKCRANCSIEFHAQCWKANENSTRGKHNWKDLLDMPCPTPGCWGLVSDVHIYRPDQDKSLKMSSQMEPKLRTHQSRPKLKTKTESVTKLERKMEKKRLRKEKKKELQITTQDLEDYVEQQYHDAASAVYQTQLNEEIANRHKDQTGTLLRKDEPEIEQRKQKTIKTKKKEKKQKQFLTVNLQFKGDEDKERYGVNSLDDDGDFVDRPPIVNPGLLPTPGSDPLPAPGIEPSVVVNGTQSSHPPETNRTDLLLYDFFYKILNKQGPTNLFSKEFENHIKHLSEESQTRIHSYGGLAKFLSSSPRFTISQNNIVSAVVPVQQGISRPGNPWEKKIDQQGESQQSRLNHLTTLNPGAKEFVPREMSVASVISESVISDKVVPATAESATNELPPPAEDSDDSFTPVVNKRHLRAQSAAHPDLSIYHILRPASSYKSMDANNHVSHLTSGVLHTALPRTVIARGGIDSLDDFLSDDIGGKLSAKSMAAETVAASSSVMVGNIGHSSNASDASGEDILGGSSPALSTNSGSSSSKAESSQSSSQPPVLRPLKAPGIIMPSRGKKKRPIGHISSKLHGHHNHPSSDGNLSNDYFEVESASSTASDKDSNYGDPRPHFTDRSLLTPVSTSSDHDSTFADTGKENISENKSQDFLSKISQDSYNFSKYHKTFGLEKNLFSDSSSLTRITQYSDKYNPIGQEPGTNYNKQKDKTWPEDFHEDKFTKGLRFKKNTTKLAESDYISEDTVNFQIKKNMTEPTESDYVFKRVEKIDTDVKNLSSVVPPVQLRVQQLQPQSRVLSQVEARSEKNKASSEVKKLPDSTWPSWNIFDGPTSYRTVGNTDVKEVTVPPSDPWLNRSEPMFPTASDVQEDVHRENLTASHHSTFAKMNLQERTLHSKQSHNNVFQPSSLSSNFGLKVKQNNPWGASPADDQSQNSPSFFMPDMTYESDNTFWSPFKDGMVAPVSSTSEELPLYEAPTYTPHEQSSIKSDKVVSEHPLYTSYSKTNIHQATDSSTSTELPPNTSSTYTPHSNTSVQAPIVTTSNTKISTSSKDTDNFNLEDRSATTIPVEPEHKNSLLQQVQGDSTDDFNVAADEYKTTEVQTTLSGAGIEKIFAQLKVLEEALSQKESAVKENFHLQETLLSCQEQLRLAKIEMEKEKEVIKKLNMRIQIAETSAEKWKNDLDKLVQDNDRLNIVNRVQADEVHDLNEKREEDRLKFLNAQMEILELKKVVAINRIELKRQEATHHLQRLANVTTQARSVNKSLPGSVYEKHKEFTSYISSCDIVQRQIEMNAQRLKEDLKQGLTIDMSVIDVNAPVFPKPPSEHIDRPQVSYTGERQTNLRNGTLTSATRSNGSQTTVTSTAALSDEGEDEDSKAYLSMFLGDKSSSGSGGSSRLKDDAPSYGAGVSQTWSEDSDERKQSFSSHATGRDINIPHRPIPFTPIRMPSVAVLPGLPIHPGKKVPKFQTETTKAVPTPVVKPQVQHPKVPISQIVPEKMQWQHLQQKPYFDRIVETVQEKLPGFSRVDIQSMVDALRRENGGSLTGWTFEALANKILDMILDLEQEENLPSSADRIVPAKHWSKTGSRFDFLCSICQSDIEPFDALTLSCGHNFHDQCVQKWLESDRSCPNCRSHALLAQDFPTLK